MEPEKKIRKKYETDEERHIGRLETNRKSNRNIGYIHQKAYQAKNYIPKKKKNFDQWLDAKTTNVLDYFKA